MTEKPTFLAADIGNSSIDIGLFENENLLNHIKLPANIKHADQWKQHISDLVTYETKPKTAVVCSVNPTVEPEFISVISAISPFEIYHLQSNKCTRLKNRCREPEKVGSDRIANAYGAWRFYELPAIVVDVGTAITIDAVNADAEFLGGAIAPGPKMSAASLATQTAQLPQIRPQPPGDVIGGDTESAIQSGIMHGAVGTILHIVSKIKKQLLSDTNVRVIVTGGIAKALEPAFGETDFCFDPDLTLKGLCAIYQTEILNND